MSYETPRIKTVEIGDLLAHLGPARAMLYEPGGGTKPTLGSQPSKERP